MDIPSKVAHTKYAVSETCISGVKLVTVIHVLKLLTMFFCIEFQIPSSCQLDVRNRCYRTTASHMMSTFCEYLLRVPMSAGYDAKSTQRS